MASFREQYGIRLPRELDSMQWLEFRSLLAGIGPDTVLGRVVTIRAENDKEMLKGFTKEQHRIRNAWRNRRAESMSKDEYDKQMAYWEYTMASLCGGGG